jgi:hypothetical protein
MTNSPLGSDGYPFPTLPDHLAPGRRLVLVGINPAIYAVQRGRFHALRSWREQE